MQAINLARDAYRPVAIRAALLYILVGTLPRLNGLYHCSLSSFERIFLRSMDIAAPEAAPEATPEAAPELSQRIADLRGSVTHEVWKYVRRGLFESDQLTVLLLMCFRIIRVDPQELAAFLSPQPVAKAPLPEACELWMPPEAWAALCSIRCRQTCVQAQAQSI